jgi:uncharacterized protein (DUF1330 family)
MTTTTLVFIIIGFAVLIVIDLVKIYHVHNYKKDPTYQEFLAYRQQAAATKEDKED